MHKGKVIGWAKLHDADTPVTLEIVTGNGELIWHGLANDYRPDLKEKGIGDGNYGFICQIPASHLDSKFLLHVRDASSGQVLPNSPIEIGESFSRYRHLKSQPNCCNYHSFLCAG